MIDPKALADELMNVTTWLTASDSPGRGIGWLAREERELIIAALRAYVPHAHKWVWTSYAPDDDVYRYHGRCECGSVRFARDLVPVEDVT